MAPGIRDQIAARRAEARSTSSSQPVTRGNATGSSRPAADGVMEDRTISGQVRRAAKSGKLDISSLSLLRIPAEVYTDLLGLDPASLSHPPTPPAPRLKADLQGMTRSFEPHMAIAEDSGNRFGGKSRVKEEWVEPEELVGLRAVENEIKELDIEIGAFGGLKSIDLRGNELSGLPNSFADLLRLTTMDLSHNAFTTIPPAILLLPALQVLDLSRNSITSIDFSSPMCPSDEALAYGAGFLSTSFSRASSSKGPRPVWPVLRSLSLGFNKLRSGELKALAGLKAMRVLNLENNSLDGVIDLEETGFGVKDLPELASLVLSGNARLRGVTGSIASGGKVETAGCCLSEIRSDTAPRPTRSRPTPSAASTLPIPLPTTTITYRSLPAATFDSLPLDVDFDLYLPARPANGVGHPLVIWFHGGGFLQGNKENLSPHLRRLPTHNYGSENIAVISPNYRLAPQVPILEILGDITTLLSFVRTKLNDRLSKTGQDGHRIDTSRICLSGGSAGGYLALIAGIEMPKSASDEEVGGYRGEEGIKCIAPFCPISDLTDQFWATKTDPVPFVSYSVSHEQAKPYLDLKAAPVAYAVSGGPRSILYAYMLQNALFPSLLFMKQKSVGFGLDAFRPEPKQLSIPHRLGLLKTPRPPVYLALGTADTAIQPLDKTLEMLRKTEGGLEVEVREGAEHQFDEDPGEECEAFREWLGKHLI